MEPNYQPPQQGGPVFLAPYKLAATTEGKPFLFGIIGAAIMLAVALMSIPGILVGAGIAEVAAQFNLDAGMLTGTVVALAFIFLVIAFLVYPGIFVILLLTGRTVPKRTKTFAIVWLVFAILNLLLGLTSLLSISGFLSFGANILILLSCVFMLQKLKAPPMVLPTPPVDVSEQ